MYYALMINWLLVCVRNCYKFYDINSISIVGLLILSHSTKFRRRNLYLFFRKLALGFGNLILNFYNVIYIKNCLRGQ